MKKVKIIFIIILTVISFLAIYGEKKVSSSASIQVVLKLPSITKNKSTASLNPPDLPPQIPTTIEVVDVEISDRLNLKLKRLTDNNPNIKLSIKVINRENKSVDYEKEYMLNLNKGKIFNIRLKNKKIIESYGKLVIATLTDSNGNQICVGFNR